MNDRVTRVVEEILTFDTEELEAVLGLGERELRSRLVPNKVSVPFPEYDKHRAYLEAGSVGFEPRSGVQGFLLLPPSSVLTLSPTARLPNGEVFAVVAGKNINHKYIVPLSGTFTLARRDIV